MWVCRWQSIKYNARIPLLCSIWPRLNCVCRMALCVLCWPLLVNFLCIEEDNFKSKLKEEAVFFFHFWTSLPCTYNQQHPPIPSGCLDLICLHFSLFVFHAGPRLSHDSFHLRSPSASHVISFPICANVFWTSIRLSGNDGGVIFRLASMVGLAELLYARYDCFEQKIGMRKEKRTKKRQLIDFFSLCFIFPL